MNLSASRFVFLWALLAPFFYQYSYAKTSTCYKNSTYRHKHGDHRVDVTIVGGVCNSDGLGRQATDVIEILKKTNTISFLPVGKILPSELAIIPESVRKVVRTNGKHFPGKVLIQESSILVAPSNEVSKSPYWSLLGTSEKTNKQVRFAYTMFESSLIPNNWANVLNTSFDAAIVPDQFLVDVYKNSGVTIPIFVIPLGRDFTQLLSAPLKKTKGSPFVFANFSGCYFRKNHLSLIRSFADAFGNDPDVQLRFGWKGYDKEAKKEILDEIAFRQLTNVKIEEGPVSSEVYNKRFMDIDCYVSLSTGEGFSIQPREAMALGIPTIVTNNTGQTTICSSGLVRVVPSFIEIPAVYHFPGLYGLQYQCRTQDVVEALKDIYDHYDDYLSKAPQAREWARQYHFTNMASLYNTLIKPKKVFLGARNEILANGTVMTTSKKLIRKYKKVFQNG